MIQETSPVVWRQLEMLFHSAAELPTDERSIYLEEACGGDAELRRRIEMLLAAADKTFGFIEKPLQEAAQNVMASGDTAGRRIGEYVVIRELGSGGMGQVYLARRADGEFEHQVAIKLMRSAFSPSQGMVSRFRAERQILANLEHPYIARLLGGGITADGLPYLVMEYVDGAPIIDYCKLRKLCIDEKLLLFRQVCEALEYAHRHLVVHRDIKPVNILVTQDGVPKLLDFGIAKLLGQEMADDGVRTVATERFLTPDYASPEQILGQQITTSTDVYALGALLYEMLCHVRPFGGERKDVLETARLICSKTPEPPSTVALHNAEIPSGEARRMRGDLDNFVLMAMRKEPVRRYASVAQLSADIDAYFKGRPLSAAPDSWRYQAGKFVRRHKTEVTLAALMVVALTGFSIGMGVLAQRAKREQLQSDQEAQFMSAMFQAATPEEAQGRTITARDLLDRGARRVDRDLASQPAVRAAMLDNIASAYRGLGIDDRAQLLMQRAYQINEQVLGANALPTIHSLDGVAELYRDQAKWSQAESSLQQVLTAREHALSPSNPVLVDTMGELGECLYWEGKNQQAEAILRKALLLDHRLGTTEAGANVRNYLALVLTRRSSFGEAAALLREAVDLDRQMHGPESPGYARSLHNLCGTLIDAGDLPDAETKLRETVSLKRKILGNDHPELALTLNNLAFVLLQEGNFYAAEPVVRETLRIWMKNYGESQYRVGLAYGKMGDLLEEKGDYHSAETYYRRALDVLSKAGGPKWMPGGILENIARLDLDRRDYRDAETYAQQALDLRLRLNHDDPEIASSLTDIALAHEFLGDAKGAEAPLRQALALRQATLAVNHPLVMAAMIRLGEALTAESKLSEAEPLLREADGVAHHPPVRLLAWQIAEADIALGQCLRALGESSEAATLLERNRLGIEAHPRACIREMDLARTRIQ